MTLVIFTSWENFSVSPMIYFVQLNCGSISNYRNIIIVNIGVQFEEKKLCTYGKLEKNANALI